MASTRPAWTSYKILGGEAGDLRPVLPPTRCRRSRLQISHEPRRSIPTAAVIIIVGVRLAVKALQQVRLLLILISQPPPAPPPSTSATTTHNGGGDASGACGAMQSFWLITSVWVCVSALLAVGGEVRISRGWCTRTCWRFGPSTWTSSRTPKGPPSASRHEHQRRRVRYPYPPPLAPFLSLLHPSNSRHSQMSLFFSLALLTLLGGDAFNVKVDEKKTVAHINDRLPTRAKEGRTPYELWTGDAPSTFTCLAAALPQSTLIQNARLHRASPNISNAEESAATGTDGSSDTAVSPSRDH